MNENSLRRYNGSEQSVLFAFLGALIIFVFFPILAYDLDSYTYLSKFAGYTQPFYCALAMGAGIIGGAVASFLYNGYLIPRDAINGMIAGAIVNGSAAHYIFNPAYALIPGFVGGLSQGLIQNFFERLGINRNKIVSTVSWSLFGIQGLIGCCFSAGWKQKAKDYSVWGNRLSSYVKSDFQPYHQILGCLVSVGIGLGFGILAGGLIYLTNFMTGNEYFEDWYYWKPEDCISNFSGQKKIHLQQPPPPNPGDIYCQEGEEEDVNNQHAYL